jgi:hypothetical protein
MVFLLSHLQRNSTVGASDDWIVDRHTHNAVSTWGSVLSIRARASELEVKLCLATCLKKTELSLSIGVNFWCLLNSLAESLDLQQIWATPVQSSGRVERETLGDCVAGWRGLDLGHVDH